VKVALIGASGQAGSRILAELVRRDHQVTAIARHPEKIAASTGVTAKKGDVFDKAGLVALLRGHDAVVSSVRFFRERSRDSHRGGARVRGEALFRRRRRWKPGSRARRQADRHSAVSRRPTKPKQARAANSSNSCATLRDLEWTFLSPSALFIAGERTGKSGSAAIGC